MAPTLAVTFTGLRFENPFLLSSAPPTCLFKRPDTTNAITSRSRGVSDA